MATYLHWTIHPIHNSKSETTTIYPTARGKSDPYSVLSGESRSKTNPIQIRVLMDYHGVDKGREVSGVSRLVELWCTDAG
jgi:hypothetical protein